jgi:putative ubiquitin-RnfH superfamily antitoxin RatB of RatAB toxin-antitoxin module
MGMVEIAYANPEQQCLLKVEVPSGCTVETAIERSGVLELFPEIDLQQQTVGIFSRPVALDHIVTAGDRIEIYRPLLVDPKAARRKRAIS